MADVLIVTDDTDVRTVLRVYLRGAGYVVLTSPVSDQALATLRASRNPLVVLLHSSLTLPGRESVLQLDRAAEAPHLTRHRYVVLGAMPYAVRPAQQKPVTRLRVQALALPFDLEEMEAAVHRAAHELEAKVMLQRPPAS